MDPKSRFELRNATSSFYNAPVTKSGIFTTTQNKEPQSNEKSTIQHLPGMRHSKVDLGSNVDFVVVFQAIENERLSEEVQNLRVKLKDVDRQLTNYLSYEVQIKQLTENCHQLEEDRTHYQNELQKMSLACNALYQQLSDAKKTYENDKEQMALQHRQQMQDLSEENQELRSMLNQLKGVLHNKQREDEENQYKTKKISQELVRLNNNLLNGQNQLHGLRDENQKKNDQLQRCMQELRNLQDGISEEKSRSEVSQRNAQDLSSQNEYLKNELGNLEREREKLQSQLSNIGSQIANKQNELKDNKNQIQTYKERLARQEAELNNAKNEIEQERKAKDNIKHDIQGILEEVEGLKKELWNKDQQNNELLENNDILSTEVTTIKEELENLVNYVNELNDRINQGIEEIAKCREALQGYEGQLQEGKNKESQLEAHISFLEPLIQENSKNKEEIFRLSEEIAQKQDELGDKDSHINDLTFENKELTNNAESLQNSINLLQNQLRQMEENLHNERGQFQQEKNRLSQQFEEIMQREQAEENEIRNELQQLKQQGLLHESTKADLRNLKEMCQKQADELSNVSRRLDVFPQIIAKLKQNNQEHIEGEKANERLREQLAHSVALNEKLIDQIGSQLQEIADLQQQVQRAEVQLRNYLDRNDDFFSTKSQSAFASTSNRSSSNIKTDLASSRPDPIKTNYNNNLTVTDTNPQSKSPYSSNSSHSHSPYVSKPIQSPYTSSPYKPEDSSYSYTKRQNSYVSNNLSRGRQTGSHTERYSPYKDLPSSGVSSKNLDKKIPRKPSQGDFKAARGIKNELVGGLAGMGREGVFQSTIFGEGPVYESKKILQTNLPPRPSENSFSKTGPQGSSSHASSFENYKRNFKG